MTDSDSQQPTLRREIGLGGAVLLGLGSILGTGAFVSLGIAISFAGTQVLMAVFLAGVVAAFNGLNSAQLAANHPVSGGTYEYGYRWLTPRLGFSAGWMFLCAKSASAATAALGFASYLSNFMNAAALPASPLILSPIAAITVLGVSTIALSGIQRSNRVNAILVGVTIFALATVTLLAVASTWSNPSVALRHFTFPSTIRSLLNATALIFVAYTGYGRVATLGEEVRNPRTTIPKAVIATLVVAMLLYAGVAFALLVTFNPRQPFLVERTDLLQVAAAMLYSREAGYLVGLGAMFAMLGVLLNLILGLSRVVLAMGRRGDMPAAMGLVSDAGVPRNATLAVTGIILALVLLGDIRLAWSFSAVTVLIYYGITNACALRMTAEERLYPRITSWCGLVCCLFLACWVDPAVWIAAFACLAVGQVWHGLASQQGRADP